MTPRLSDHFSIFGLVLFVLKSILRIARQWNRKKFAFLTQKPQSHVRKKNMETSSKTDFAHFLSLDAQKLWVAQNGGGGGGASAPPPLQARTPMLVSDH